jgi:hypothetical protein
MTLAAYLRARPRAKIHRELALPNGAENFEEEEFKPRVIIIDQFEELLTTNINYWRKRQDFFIQLREAVQLDPTLSILFVMRADFISKLDSFAQYLPGRLQARYGLERLSLEQATEAVLKPARKHGRPFDAGVAESIVTDLSQRHLAEQDITYEGEVVEPVQLQVVCYRLWESLSWDNDNDRITADDLKKIGNSSQVLEDFYNRIVKEVTATTATPETDIRLWFSRELITPTRIRSQVGTYNRKAGSLPLVTVNGSERDSNSVADGPDLVDRRNGRSRSVDAASLELKYRPVANL